MITLAVALGLAIGGVIVAIWALAYARLLSFRVQALEAASRSQEGKLR